MLIPQFFISLKKYNRSLFTSDLFAGTTVAVVALPLAMAFAIASGVTPEQGIFTAIIAGFIISFFGGSKVQIGGPTGAFIVVVSGIIANYGYGGLVYATIMAGILLIIFGLSKMGAIIKFIPFPVITGFTSGIAVIIFSTQIKDLLGLDIEKVPSGFISEWVSYFHCINTLNISAFCIGLVTILLIIILKKYFPKSPNMLIAMIAATAITTIFGLDVETIGSKFGELPRTLPAPNFPDLDLNYKLIKELATPAFTIAMLAAIESLLSAAVSDGMIESRHNSNMELIAQGLANIGASIFSGIPATGAIARTAVNVKTGGKTPMAGIIHAIVLALMLLFLAPMAKLIPLSALAGILVVVSYNMSEISSFMSLFKAPRSDIIVLFITFFLTVLLDLTIAVQVGLVLAAFLFIKRMSEISNISVITKELNAQTKLADDPNSIMKRTVPDGVEVFEISGPFFFGAADKFKSTISLMMSQTKVIILRMRDVPAIDATGIHVIEDYFYSCKRKSIYFILSGVHAQPIFALNKSGLLNKIGEENIFGNIDDSLNRARELLGLPKEKRPEPFVPSVMRENHLAE